MKKSNKLVAGYHLLNMIATVEGQIDAQADLVIRQYLSSEALLRVNLDDELDEIILLDESNFDDHFIQKAKDYYDDSNENEREEFKVFAQKLIRADDEISDGENHCYKLLLKTWRAKNEEK
ncbi:TerB family tellurite resistance protein [Flavobacteriaceae bacterium Ap0902]|nr:TerB family tellurite resistance protein [Flavobacteriaceae bacterium Ap0902]